MIGVSIRQLTKRFGSTLALDSVDLEIEPGEMFFLLGPSGCGKTTLLRCLAGFLLPEEGSIRFGGEEVTRQPPHLRRTGMVFQNYALWPHKNVAQNVAFGLEEARVPKDEIVRRVGEALAAVRMEGYGTRSIHQLSGGQQQRVALARALVIRPRCLLLDEPLSNLDAKLRLEMRTEIRRICKEAGLTAIYVTHDQKEALSVADRIAVLESGRICQIGTPERVYRQPATRFVADFIGETNFFPAVVVGPRLLEVAGERWELAREVAFAKGEAVSVSIRPEAWRMVAEAAPGALTLPGRVAQRVYLGETAQYEVDTEVGRIKVHELNPRPDAARQAGEPCLLTVERDDLMVFAL
ncbi:MAG TPA: ABC transporter ATP-binding protein [Chthoniobacteraceae bacterium]|nr:ABC transporter ATP-binding protein [Chthoniobacteraceae bacterium]